jgi:hypothetical protein
MVLSLNCSSSVPRRFAHRVTEHFQGHIQSNPGCREVNGDGADTEESPYVADGQSLLHTELIDLVDPRSYPPPYPIQGNIPGQREDQLVNVVGVLSATDRSGGMSRVCLIKV